MGLGWSRSNGKLLNCCCNTQLNCTLSRLLIVPQCVIRFRSVRSYVSRHTVYISYNNKKKYIYIFIVTKHVLYIYIYIQKQNKKNQNKVCHVRTGRVILLFVEFILFLNCLLNYVQQQQLRCWMTTNFERISKVVINGHSTRLLFLDFELRWKWERTSRKEDFEWQTIFNKNWLYLFLKKGH